MRVLVFSDMHFFDEPALLAGVPSRRSFQEATCEWIAAQIREHQPQIVVNLGDTNHRQGLIDMPTLSLMVTGLTTIQRAAAEVGAVQVHVAGNHDRYDALGEDSVVAAFPDYAGLPGSPSVLKVVRDEVYLDWGRVGFVPYISATDPTSFGARLAGLHEAGVRALFVHQDIGGALWHAGMRDESGFDPSLMEKFSLVVGGHYHHPQRIGDNVVIVGSPFYFNFSDSWIPDEPRGLLVVDFAEDMTASIFRIENPHTPIRHTVSIERSTDMDAVLAEMESFGVTPRMILRVRCSRAATAERVRAAYSNCGLMRLVVQDLSGGPQRAPVEAIDLGQDDRPEETVRQHVERATTTLDRNHLMEVGLRFVGGDD